MSVKIPNEPGLSKIFKSICPLASDFNLKLISNTGKIKNLFV